MAAKHKLSNNEKIILWHMRNNWILEGFQMHTWKLVHPESGRWFKVPTDEVKSVYCRDFINTKSVVEGLSTMYFTDRGAKLAMDIQRSDFEMMEVMDDN